MDASCVYLLVVAFGGAMQALVVVLYALYVVRDVGLSPFQLMIIGTGMEAAALLFEVPTGVVADLVSRRLSVILGYFVIAVGFVLMAIPEFWSVALGQILWGLGFTFISGAREAWLADEVGEDRAGVLYPRGARWRLTAMIAAALAGGAIGLIAPQWTFLVAGVGLGGMVAVLLFVMPERGWQPVPRGERSSWAAVRGTAVRGLRATRAKPVLVAAFILAALMGMSSESFDRLWGFLLIEEVGMPGTLNDVVVFTGLYVISQLGGIAVIRLVEHRTALGRARSVTTALLLLNGTIVLAMLAFGLAPVFGVALAAYWLTVWARNAEEPFFTAWVNRGLDPATRATVLSTVSQANALGQIAGGPAFGLIAQLATVRAAIAAAAVVLLPALPLYARERRRADGEASEG
ncbi:MAG: MFS transporter [Dehalococcoidia bacterium]|nr:MFS transporter [Dehalococcoidia bacterium]